MHVGEHVNVLTTPTDTGNGGVTMPFFKASTSSADLLKERDAIATWARMTYGWMGRSSTRRSIGRCRRTRSATCS